MRMLQWHRLSLAEFYQSWTTAGAADCAWLRGLGNGVPEGGGIFAGYFADGFYAFVADAARGRV